ncbi:MAG: SUMF1/EgtB/PvdO family nonheme iron enzyme [Candidatus Hydrogenedentes bacterium]|nr:SUMF1/EgtB/PvdO family nonheme iron enzyme [Candidatus Hydrogenedentota bacterium]MBI3118488.1 SUMF1/EgtB/PvdO family nonheme iron enzyme [Candidatus Hydrogenedentota bacterium]
MIQVNCLHCGLSIYVPPTVQGKKGVCFNCGQPIRVPVTHNPIKRNDLVYEKGDRVTDRYIIEERIGKGGMGVVYRAHDTLIDETVALKFMNPRMLRTQRGQQLFIQEAQIARKLRHENIVAVHDVNWTADGILYLSMEFVNGQSLRDMLRKHRSDRKLVEVRLAIAISRQILSALEFAHRTVIHRDMKPENVMLMTAERVKVLDFGLAQAVHDALSQEGESQQSDKQKRVIGTLAYTAPEQRKMEAVDLRADIFAVGLMLHELFTLRTPMDEPVMVGQVRNDVSPSLLGVLDKALMEEKERRWQSAREFREALMKAFEDSYNPARSSQIIMVKDRAEQASTENMVYLEGGSFLMGYNEVREEAPEQEMTVEPFWMDIYPVTVKEYRKFIEETGAPEPKYWRDPQFNGPNQPVVGVSWLQARAYAEWAGKLLPTEVQWEFAARGKENRRYPWGNLQPDPTLCNFNDYLGMPSMVTMHEEGRTPDGIYDLGGNVMEWTLDAFLPYAHLRQNPQAAENVPRKVARGGCWSSRAEDIRTTSRKGPFMESQLATLGFRCVVPVNRAG